jgi:hypothetical protein
MLGSEHWDCLTGKGKCLLALSFGLFGGQQFYKFNVKYVLYEYSVTV